MVFSLAKKSKKSLYGKKTIRQGDNGHKTHHPRG